MHVLVHHKVNVVGRVNPNSNKNAKVFSHWSMSRKILQFYVVIDNDEFQRWPDIPYITSLILRMGDSNSQMFNILSVQDKVSPQLSHYNSSLLPPLPSFSVPLEPLLTIPSLLHINQIQGSHHCSIYNSLSSFSLYGPGTKDCGRRESLSSLYV